MDKVHLRKTGLGVIGLLAIGCATRVWAAQGELELTVLDAATREPTAVRMELRNARGKPVRVPAAVTERDYFWFDGKIVLKLPRGHYTFRMEKGPEYRARTGNFTIEQGAADHHEVDMQRTVPMSQEGWWSGDLHIERPARDMPLLMLAEDLHVAAVVNWTNDDQRKPAEGEREWSIQKLGHDRLLWVGAGRDSRPGGDLLYFGMAEPATLPRRSAEFPPPFPLARQAHTQQGVHLHLGQVVAWDLPAWLASGQLDSVGLLHYGLQHDRSLDAPSGRPRDPVLFPDPYGTGRWAQQVYFQLLESGHRIPPAAGSGAGWNSNPPGYNRLYVYCGEEFSEQAWWQGLRAGRVVLTNGPLLRPRANGQLPGHVFAGQPGEPVELKVALQLSTQEKIDYLEVIQNGRPVQQVRLEDWAARNGQLAPVVFQESGWLLVRVVTQNPQAYRCACSGPFYVEFDGRPRISRTAAAYFLDGVQQRAGQIKLADARQQRELLRYYRAARDYWQRRVAEANVD